MSELSEKTRRELDSMFGMGARDYPSGYNPMNPDDPYGFRKRDGFRERDEIKKSTESTSGYEKKNLDHKSESGKIDRTLNKD
jgi:hypothetical protein